MLATVKRAPRAALVALALASPLAGCGGSTTATSTGASAPTTSATTPATPRTSTSSSSSSSSAANPATYGHLGGSSQQAAVTRVVKAYYAALSSDHEATACRMLTTRIRQRLESSIGRNPLLHGKGCVGAFNLIFGHRGRASAISTTVAVTALRVEGDRGYALFSTQSIPSAEIRVERERGAWKIGSLIGSPLPGYAASRSR